MHIKFLAHGTGSGRDACEYLLGTHDHNGKRRAEVRVLRGDPEIVGQLADSLTFVHRYTSGVINWSPTDNPTPDQIDAVLDDFERVAFAGLDPARVAHSAILHREDNGGVHVHVLTARVDLETGKSLNIAPPGWEKTYDPLRDMYNHLHGWARPDDPMRARVVQPGKRALIDASALRRGMQVEPDIKGLVTEYLLIGIDAGEIVDRAGILSALLETGLEINRASRDFVSVRDPETGGKYRLKGRIYKENWTAAADAGMNAQIAAEGFGGPDLEAAEQARADLEAAVERRSTYNSGRYPAPPAPAPAPVLVARKRTPKPKVTPDDGDRNALVRVLEALEQSVHRAREAFNRAVGRCQRAVGDYDRAARRYDVQLSELVEATRKFEQEQEHEQVNLADMVDLDRAMTQTRSRKPGAGPGM